MLYAVVLYHTYLYILSLFSTLCKVWTLLPQIWAVALFLWCKLFLCLSGEFAVNMYSNEYTKTKKHQYIRKQRKTGKKRYPCVLHLIICTPSLILPNNHDVIVTNADVFGMTVIKLIQVTFHARLIYTIRIHHTAMVFQCISTSSKRAMISYQATKTTPSHCTKVMAGRPMVETQKHKSI